MLGPIRPLVTLTVIFMCSQLSSANQPSKHAKRDVVYVSRPGYGYFPIQVPAAAPLPPAAFQNVAPPVQAFNYPPGMFPPWTPAVSAQSDPAFVSPWGPSPPINVMPGPAIAPVSPMDPVQPVQDVAPAVVSAPAFAPAASVPLAPVLPAPAIASYPSPIPAADSGATWQPPPNNALTFTSYAGLLTTKAPAFYPSPSSEPPVVNTPVPAPAPVPPTPAYTPTPNVPSVSWPSQTAVVESAPSRLLTASLPSPTMASVSDRVTEAATAVHTSTLPESTSSDSESSSVSEESTKETTTTTTKTTSTTTSTEVTVSTTTTTRGDTTHTTTTVGSDGTTTVLTQYPTSTRTRVPQNTSGAQSMHIRGRLMPRTNTESVLGYLSDMLISHPKFIMTVAAMTGAVLLPSAMFVMA